MDDGFLFPEVKSTPGHDLFIALLPPPEIREQIRNCATGLMAKHGLSGSMRPEDHFHVTLGDFTKSKDPLDRIFEAAQLACQATAAAIRPFDLTLDHARGFPRSEKNAIVLASRTPGPEIAALRNRLASELVKQRCRLSLDSGKTPHVTFLYSSQMMASEEIEPIRWTVSEVSLIYSHKGETRYEKYGPWRLFGSE